MSNELMDFILITMSSFINRSGYNTSIQYNYDSVILG